MTLKTEFTRLAAANNGAYQNLSQRRGLAQAGLQQTGGACQGYCFLESLAAMVGMTPRELRKVSVVRTASQLNQSLNAATGIERFDLDAVRGLYAHQLAQAQIHTVRVGMVEAFNDTDEAVDFAIRNRGSMNFLFSNHATCCYLGGAGGRYFDPNYGHATFNSATDLRAFVSALHNTPEFGQAYGLNLQAYLGTVVLQLVRA